MLLFLIGMGDLAGASDSPAIGVVAGLANSTDLHSTWIMVLNRIQAVGAGVFFLADEFDWSLKVIVLPILGMPLRVDL